MRRILGFSDQERADLIEAMRAAQGELCCGQGFPEANAINERWEKLIERLSRTDGATMD